MCVNFVLCFSPQKANSAVARQKISAVRIPLRANAESKVGKPCKSGRDCPAVREICQHTEYAWDVERCGCKRGFFGYLGSAPCGGHRCYGRPRWMEYPCGIFRTAIVDNALKEETLRYGCALNGAHHYCWRQRSSLSNRWCWGMVDDEYVSCSEDSDCAPEKHGHKFHNLWHKPMIC